MTFLNLNTPAQSAIYSPGEQDELSTEIGTKVTELKDSTPKGPLLLCLSGGGFRATLFHLGVIDYLRGAGLLSSISGIFGVSGGAVAAAALNRNWPQFVGNKKAYHEVVAKLHALCMSNAIGRAYAKAVIGGEGLFESFSELLNAELPGTESDDAPSTFLVCSSLTTQRQLAFEMKTGVYYEVLASESIPDTRTDTRRDPLEQPIPQLALVQLGKVKRDHWSRAAMRSACFPVVFSPQAIGHVELNKLDPPEQEVADGGILDNLGIWAAQAFAQSAENKFGGAPPRFIVSDASAAIPPMTPSDTRGARTIRGALRTVDYLMNAVAAGNLRSLTRTYPKGVSHVALQFIQASDTDPSLRELDDTTRRFVSTVRTNFNGFDAEEVVLLHRAGFCCARHAVAGPPKLSTHSNEGRTTTAFEDGYAVSGLPLNKNIVIDPNRASTNNGAPLVVADRLIAKPRLTAFAALAFVFGIGAVFGLTAFLINFWRTK